MLEAVIVPLILLMIVGAFVAIETPNLLHAVISVGAVGFLLSIVFLFLSAPDLAITQLAVEVITLVILLRAVTRSEPDPRKISVPACAETLAVRSSPAWESKTVSSPVRPSELGDMRALPNRVLSHPDP